MNLSSTVSIYGGGVGSGCHGPNCGRPSIGLKKISSTDRKSLAALYPALKYRKADGYRISVNRELGGLLLVHLEKNRLIVDWISGTTPYSVGIVRGLVEELKVKYPKADYLVGKRITGVRTYESDRDKWTELKLR